MPVHDGSRSDQDESLSPPGPERSQRNPEQLVQGSQSSARPLRVQSGQLPTESQAFKDEVLAGAKRADDPPEEMPERHNHGKNNIGTIRIQLCAKSFILQVYDLLARHRPSVRGKRNWRKTASHSLARRRIGWEAWTRTRIARSRVWSPTNWTTSQQKIQNFHHGTACSSSQKGQSNFVSVQWQNRAHMHVHPA